MDKNLLTQLELLAFKLQHWYMKGKITRERVSRHYAFFHPRPTKTITLDEFKRRSQIVLATGCFDVLHQEHKKFLKAAKALDGWFYVGLESDKRVRQLKGQSRPVNSLNQRLTNLRRLKIADHVFGLPENFTTTTARRKLIKQIHPDILAVSSHTPNLPVKRRLMAEVGGRVKIVLKQNPKISTTKIIKTSKIKINE